MEAGAACKISLPVHAKTKENELQWEYDCLDCGLRFRIKVPKGPKDERAIKCPHCKSKNLNKLEVPLNEATCPG